MSDYNIYFSNIRKTPYKIQPYVSASNRDNLNTKVEIYNGKRLSYLKGITVNLYLNYTGSWTNYSSSNTNKKGITNINYDIEPVPNTVTNCLGYVKATINGQTITSNFARFNFIDRTFTGLICIDASMNNVDRSDYDIIDAGTGNVDRSDYNIYSN